MKGTLIEIKNNLQGNKSRVDEAKNQISDLEHRKIAKMRIQRNMFQVKDQIKTPEKELNKMAISNLSDAEFKPLVIRMLRELSEDLTA